MTIPKLQKALITSCFLILSGSAFTSISNNSSSLAWTTSSQQLKTQVDVFKINPILDSDIQFTDLSKNFAYPATAAQIRAGNGGNYILLAFLNLLYSEFLTPLSKANPDLHIPPQPSDPEAFFVANGIEQTKGYLQNHDGDTLMSSWSETAPSYPTTLAVVQLLNIFLLPLDQSNEFEQLAAKDPSGDFNLTSGFFFQFINYILTEQLGAMLGRNYYQPMSNGTSINTGMFDFDAGFNYYVEHTGPGPSYIIDSGRDKNNTTFAGLSSQINNFMFLLDNYVNFAAEILNNFTSITSDSIGQWLLLNNLVTLGAFHTPNLHDAAAEADRQNVIYDDKYNAAATIFTAFPRFMINASYGDGPSKGASRDWGANDNHYMLLLHYNGLISGNLLDSIEHHEFLHSSDQNTGYYYAYTDTTALNSLKAEQQIIGQMLYLRAWNSEVNYLWTYNRDVFNAICLNNWSDTGSVKNNLTVLDNKALLIQSDDKVNGLFTAQSLIKRLQQGFNRFMALNIETFQNHFAALLYLYSHYHYGFQEHQNGNPIVNPYVDLTTLSEITPQTVAPYDFKAKAFKTEQTTILTAMAGKIKALYKPINLGFVQHINGEALKYPLPDLRNDDPLVHGCVNQAALYTFYADQVKTAYFNNFKLEQLAIQKEHQNVPKPQPHFPLWAIILIVASAVISIGLMVLFFMFRARRSTQSLASQTPAKTLD